MGGGAEYSFFRIRGRGPALSGRGKGQNEEGNPFARGRKSSQFAGEMQAELFFGVTFFSSINLYIFEGVFILFAAFSVFAGTEHTHQSPQFPKVRKRERVGGKVAKNRQDVLDTLCLIKPTIFHYFIN